MSRLQDRLLDLPPERYARGVHAAADLAIRAAKLAGRAAPEDALWLKAQSLEELRAQQERRLHEAETRPQRESVEEAATAEPGDVLSTVLAGIADRSPGRSSDSRTNWMNAAAASGLVQVKHLTVKARQDRKLIEVQYAGDGAHQDVVAVFVNGEAFAVSGDEQLVAKVSGGESVPVQDIS